MWEITDNNPTTWKQKLKEKYGIIVDDHFWENNPVQSKSYIALGTSGGALSRRKPTLQDKIAEVTELCLSI